MSTRDCLSILEIAAYHAGEETLEAAQHLAICVRCRALLDSMPKLLEPVPAEPVSDLPRLEPRAVSPLPEELKTGQLWAAKVEGQAGLREIVAVLAQEAPVDGQERVLVAPVETNLNAATDTDLIVESSPLGYEHLVSVGLQGVILREQLDRYFGRMDMPAREALVAIYRALWGGAEHGIAAPTGLPLIGPDDPRAMMRDERLDQLRLLFAPADRLLGREQGHECAEVVTLGGIVAGAITGDDWDRPSLLTAAEMDGSVLDGILNDRLDLTDQADVPAVQRVVNVLQLSDWREPVYAALQCSPGGERKATGAEPAIAARSFAGVSDEERERDLMRDQTEIDQSAQARERAIERYLRALEKEIDDAE